MVVGERFLFLSQLRYLFKISMIIIRCLVGLSQPLALYCDNLGELFVTFLNNCPHIDRYFLAEFLKVDK